MHVLLGTPVFLLASGHACHSGFLMRAHFFARFRRQKNRGVERSPRSTASIPQPACGRLAGFRGASAPYNPYFAEQSAEGAVFPLQSRPHGRAAILHAPANARGSVSMTTRPCGQEAIETPGVYTGQWPSKIPPAHPGSGAGKTAWRITERSARNRAESNG
jgi:hypothetical protein